MAVYLPDSEMSLPFSLFLTLFIFFMSLKLRVKENIRNAYISRDLKTILATLLNAIVYCLAFSRNFPAIILRDIIHKIVSQSL